MSDMIYIEDLGPVYDEIEEEWKERINTFWEGGYFISTGFIHDIMEDVRKRTWKIPSVNTESQRLNTESQCLVSEKSVNRPGGYWIYREEPGTFDVYRCSECKCDSEVPYKFCPNCGSYNGGESND